MFSGYGVKLHPGRPDLLAGLLVVDMPRPADPLWLQAVANTYGECNLLPMTADGKRGLACRMEIDPESLPYLERFPIPLSDQLEQALQPFLTEPPVPQLRLRWDPDTQLWQSHFIQPNELLPELRILFEAQGYGCLAVASDRSVQHICHAPDRDIEGFRGKPVLARWQLVEMPTAPLVRLEATILDDLVNPYHFESFLNVNDPQQLGILTELAGQEALHLAFYGDDLAYRYTKSVPQSEQQWQQLDEILERALAYWEQLPEEVRDFDQAKAVFMRFS